jgi:hypothetical protein
MPEPPSRRVFDPAGLAVFLAELQGFFEACDELVDDAVEAHFGFLEAVDWIAVSLELAREDLAAHPPTPDLTSQHTQGSA